MKESEIAVICKALGDENRVQILKMLTGGELCACKILDAFNITQPTLSHHMKILTDCNLVNSRKEGKWTYYSINNETFSNFKNAVSEFTCKTSSKKKVNASTNAAFYIKPKSRKHFTGKSFKPQHSKNLILHILASFLSIFICQGVLLLE